MKNLPSTPPCARLEWVRRFAYRAMLCRNELDTTSALTIADSQFDGLRDSDPEAAAETFADSASDTAFLRAPSRNALDTAPRSAMLLTPA